MVTLGGFFAQLHQIPCMTIAKLNRNANNPSYTCICSELIARINAESNFDINAATCPTTLTDGYMCYLLARRSSYCESFKERHQGVPQYSVQAQTEIDIAVSVKEAATPAATETTHSGSYI